jgi:hypothetical protein
MHPSNPTLQHGSSITLHPYGAHSNAPRPLHQVELSKTYSKAEWHEDLKKVLKMAGEANKQVVFLFSDTQIKEESFVEDISNLLNTCEVPNLMQVSPYWPPVLLVLQ